jgi:hypothetical protein
MLSEKTIFVGSNINIRARGYTLPPPYGRRPNSKPERTGTWQGGADSDSDPDRTEPQKKVGNTGLPPGFPALQTRRERSSN